MRTLIITLTLLALLALPAVAQADGPLSWPGPFRSAESEFYRGVYTTCLFAAAYAGLNKAEAVGACRQATDQARATGWYEQPSPGWELRQVPAGWGSET